MVNPRGLSSPRKTRRILSRQVVARRRNNRLIRALVFAKEAPMLGDRSWDRDDCGREEPVPKNTADSVLYTEREEYKHADVFEVLSTVNIIRELFIGILIKESICKFKRSKADLFW